MAAGQFQPTEVVKSQEKTIIQGKIYYIHTVLKGQTLYSICKAYDVTQEDIRRENPEIDPDNLREGLAIRIPESKPRQAALYPQNREDFYAHTVKKGQTVYSLSRKYKVTEEVIYYYNPWAREGIREDQTIWIPRKKEMQDISGEARANDLFYYYTVKDQETLYSISLLYGLNVSDIVDANPELREGLKAGQVLRIPRIKPAEPAVTGVADSLLTSANPCMPAEESVTYNVALLLPFFAELTMEETALPADTITEEGTYVPAQKQQGLRGRSFAEFYEGFMMALDSLRKTGLSVNLHVKDTEHDTLKIKKIVKELSVLQPDLIIGPVFAEDVSITGRLARYLDISLVSPLSTRPQLVAGNPSIFQVIPPRQEESYALARYLKNTTKGQVVLIRGTDSISMSNSWRFKKHLLENMPCDPVGNPLVFRDYKLNDSLINVLSKVLTKEDDNIIVVFSDNEPDVSRLLTRIYMMSTLYPVRLLGMPSWQAMKSIDLTYLHNLQVSLITPFFTDYTNPEIARYLSKSREVYGYEPYEITSLGYNFSMLGYDIGLFFLSALKQYGRDFQQCLDQLDSEKLLSRFRFSRQGTGGYVNNSYMLIQYRKDFTVARETFLDDGPAY
jgi:LysM repeat protein/ABC-type branched-subunit amino acid transport system substrate-binding protein